MIAPATPLADVLERELQSQVVQIARTFHWNLIYHTHDSRRSAHGFPDLVLLRERAVFIEMKREKGKLASGQSLWLRGLLDASCEAYLVRPRHLQALAEILACRGHPWLTDGPVAVTAAGLREELRREVDA